MTGMHHTCACQHSTSFGTDMSPVCVSWGFLHDHPHSDRSVGVFSALNSSWTSVARRCFYLTALVAASGPAATYSCLEKVPDSFTTCLHPAFLTVLQESAKTESYVNVWVFLFCRVFQLPMGSRYENLACRLGLTAFQCISSCDRQCW